MMTTAVTSSFVTGASLKPEASIVAMLMLWFEAVVEMRSMSVLERFCQDVDARYGSYRIRVPGGVKAEDGQTSLAAAFLSLFLLSTRRRLYLHACRRSCE